MQKYTRKSKHQSPTTDPYSPASKQAPVNTILQQYKGSIQRTAVEEEEDLLQRKSDPAQREEMDEEELLQGKFDTSTTLQKEEERPPISGNNTGIPDNLKSGVETLSGYSMDDVRVHYNSSRPAQLQALAYAQGTDIHIAPGQEQHLPHEMWHVVQQKQGRVQPTMQLQGLQVNDQEGLEKEADVMGEKSLSVAFKSEAYKLTESSEGKISHTIQKEIDEIKTKEMLGEIYEKLKVTSIDVWPNMIYSILGTEKADKNYFDKLSDDAFTEDIRSQTYGKYSSEIVYNKSPQGDYFHIENIGGNVNERMILNLCKQSDALSLVRHIAENRKKQSLQEKDIWIRSVSSAKFYACSPSVDKPPKSVKYDKVVIYYDEIYQTAIKNGVLSFLGIRDQEGNEDEKQRQTKFNINISGFYNKIGPGMGVGEEIGGGTSFTGERRKDILAYIASLLVLPEKEIFIEDAYNTVAMSRIDSFVKRTFG